MNFDKVIEVGKKGLFTGLGTFLASSFIDSYLKSFTKNNLAMTNAGLIAGGTGLAFASDEYLSGQSKTVTQMVEHVGYGISARGWGRAGAEFQRGFTGKGGAPTPAPSSGKQSKAQMGSMPGAEAKVEEKTEDSAREYRNFDM